MNMFTFWRIVDTISHRLIIPDSLQNYICDRYDESLGWNNESK